jgi:hypothetical protein
MQKFFDEWFLRFLFVLTGGVIEWTVWRGWS